MTTTTFPEQVAPAGSAVQKLWDRGEDKVTYIARAFSPATYKGDALIKAACRELKPITGYRETDNRGIRRQQRTWANETIELTVTYFPATHQRGRAIESASIYVKGQ